MSPEQGATSTKVELQKAAVLDTVVINTAKRMNGIAIDHFQVAIVALEAIAIIILRMVKEGINTAEDTEDRISIILNTILRVVLVDMTIPNSLNKHSNSNSNGINMITLEVVEEADGDTVASSRELEHSITTVINNSSIRLNHSNMVIINVDHINRIILVVEGTVVVAVNIIIITVVAEQEVVVADVMIKDISGLRTNLFYCICL